MGNAVRKDANRGHIVELHEAVKTGPRPFLNKEFLKEVEPFVAEAIKDAEAENRAFGLPDIVKVNGIWSKKYADGRVVPIGSESVA